MAYTTAVRVSYYLLVFGGYVHMHVPRNTTTWVPERVLARGGGQRGTQMLVTGGYDGSVTGYMMGYTVPGTLGHPAHTLSPIRQA